MIDKMGHGGVHGAKDTYNHVDLRSTNKCAIPVSAKDNMQTLKALNQIFGDYPVRMITAITLCAWLSPHGRYG